MRKFTFRFEAVLRQRKQQEEKCQKEYALALKDVQEVEARIDTKKLELNEALSNDNFALGANLDVNQLVDRRRYVEHIYFELNGLNEELMQKKQVATHRQHFLIMASKERQAMSKLKEKKQEDWWKESLIEEQKELDEVGLQMTRRSV